MGCLVTVRQNPHRKEDTDGLMSQSRGCDARICSYAGVTVLELAAVLTVRIVEPLRYMYRLQC